MPRGVAFCLTSGNRQSQNHYEQTQFHINICTFHRTLDGFDGHPCLYEDDQVYKLGFEVEEFALSVEKIHRQIITR